MGKYRPLRPMLLGIQFLVASVSLLHLRQPAVASEKDGKGEAEMKEALQLYHLGLYEEAAKVFARLSGDYPDVPEFDRNLGACFYYLRWPGPAISNLRQYLTRKKDIPPLDKAEVERWINEMEKLRDQHPAPGSPTVGVATSASNPAATQLFEDARVLFERGELASACDKFAESQQLDPQLGTLLHLAACYEKIGKTATAWASFKEAVSVASRRHDSREAAARAAVAKLEPHLCRLTIAVGAGTPPDLQVSKNGTSIGSALLGSPMPIDPGDYLLMAKAEGFEDWTKRIAIAPGMPDTRIEVPALIPRSTSSLVATNSQQPSSPAPAMLPPATSVQQPQLVTSPKPEDPGLRRRMVGYSLGVVGLVGIGVGIAAGIAKEAKQSDRDSANACSKTFSCTTLDENKVNQLTNEAKTRATVANVGFVAGGVALAAGAVLVVTGWPKSTPSASAQVQPWIGDKSAGFAVGGAW